MPAPRIVIEHFSNDLIREFHVNERISSEKLYDSLPGADALKYRIGEVAPSTSQTALSFYEIEGVTPVSALTSTRHASSSRPLSTGTRSRRRSSTASRSTCSGMTLRSAAVTLGLHTNTDVRLQTWVTPLTSASTNRASPRSKK